MLIFAENKSDVDDVHEYLLLKGVEAVAVHGGKFQDEREDAIKSFKSGDKDVLVVCIFLSFFLCFFLCFFLSFFVSFFLSFFLFLELTINLLSYRPQMLPLRVWISLISNTSSTLICQKKLKIIFIVLVERVDVVKRELLLLLLIRIVL